VRGDGPNVCVARLIKSAFSPRAWGWSANILPRLCLHRVLPTCVGMVRSRSPSLKIPLCSPHVRGDGPQQRRRRQRHKLFSPRAWGWSVSVLTCSLELRVLPTCVGMVRQQLTGVTLDGRSPHVRGDGPPRRIFVCPSAEFSPRAWGWSVPLRFDGDRASVLPTCVGMVRRAVRKRRNMQRSPHVRGDGPIAASDTIE